MSSRGTNGLVCIVHSVQLEYLGGRNAHKSNWYCPQCEEQKKLFQEFLAEATEAQTTLEEVL